MERLGIIGGSAFLEGLPDGSEERLVRTDRGEVAVCMGDGYVFLRRHGHDGYRPAHRLDHHAHVLALEELGVRRVVSVCSVGALNPSHRPGTVLVPEDYMSLQAPPTFALDERLHVIPLLDSTLRARLVSLSRRVAEGEDGWQETTAIAAARSDIRDGGVYAETRGPRFETRAEIRLLADYADVVGMTAASEATLLQERGIASAILCIVDNYAHGIGARPLTFEAFERQLGQNRQRVFALVRALMADGPALAAPAPAPADTGTNA